MKGLPIYLLSAALLHAQDTGLTIQTVEGEGMIYQTGSRSARGITVEVTDATGAKIPGATVSFQLPQLGPTGTFPTGSRTEIVPTGADGRAAVWGMRWGGTPGEVQIRVTAARGASRASRVIPVTLATSLAGQTPQIKSGGGGHKWVWIALLAAGAAGGATMGLAGKSQPGASAPAQQLPPAIGVPTIVIGRP